MPQVFPNVADTSHDNRAETQAVTRHVLSDRHSARQGDAPIGWLEYLSPEVQPHHSSTLCYLLHALPTLPRGRGKGALPI